MRPSPAAFGVDLSRNGRGEAAGEADRVWIFASPAPGEVKLPDSPGRAWLFASPALGEAGRQAG